MADALILPPRTRAKLGELYLAQQKAAQDFQIALDIAREFLGIDPTVNANINFETGAVTPIHVPTPIREPPTGLHEADVGPEARDG